MNKTTQDAVNQYELLNPLLTGIYKEMQELSKKKPDSPLNAFKVKAINRILEPIKEMLKMENTHAFLDVWMLMRCRLIVMWYWFKSVYECYENIYEKYYTYNSKDGHKWRIQS